MKTAKRPGRIIVSGTLIASMALVASVCGCREVQDFFKTDSRRLFNAAMVIDAPGRATISPILDGMGPADPPRSVLPLNAAEPREEDLEYVDTDYVIGPADVLNISIMDLFEEGRETPVRRQVSESGYISLPELPQRVKAEGRDAEQLKEDIKKSYARADILRDPVVAVTVMYRRNDVYSLIGLGGSGRYNITQKGMRLLEALAAVGGNVDPASVPWILVIRPSPVRRKHAAPGALGELPTPVATSPSSAPASVPTARDEAVRDVRGLLGPEGGAPGPAPSEMVHLSEVDSTSTVTSVAPTSRAYKWVWSNGQWVQTVEEVPATNPESKPGSASAPASAPARPVRPVHRIRRRPSFASAPKTKQDGDPFGWRGGDRTEGTRIIAINTEKLLDADRRMNIVIRNNDVIRVPPVQAGEFYVMGQVVRPGVYSLTGRQITVKMAVAAAGNFDELAWPENSILIRRIGKNQEQVYPIDIDAIFRGEEADMFLRPDDVIAVGSDVRAPLWATLRNAFRLTYGFGFIYDRNFADPASVGMNSRRFSRW